MDSHQASSDLFGLDDAAAAATYYGDNEPPMQPGAVAADGDNPQLLPYDWNPSSFDLGSWYSENPALPQTQSGSAQHGSDQLAPPNVLAMAPKRSDWNPNANVNGPGPSAQAPRSNSSAPAHPPQLKTNLGMLSGQPPQLQQPALTAAQRYQLQKIAMPGGLPTRSPNSDLSPGSAAGIVKASSASSPEDIDLSTPTLISRKRKPSDGSDDYENDDLDGQHPQKKNSHNMIEKRYRTNLNDKIALLRDSVPSLRIMQKSAKGLDTSEEREELHGLTPAHKLNKATVLSKATEYIYHLRKRNDRLTEENHNMAERIAAFEKLIMSSSMNGGGVSPLQQPPQQQQPTPSVYPHDRRYVGSPIDAPEAVSPRGMIQVPDDMKRILSAQLAAGQQPYPVPQQSYQPNPAMFRQQQIQQQHMQQVQPTGWQNAGPYFGKLMVGSLAGLMLFEAAYENEASNETPEGRGLMALPLHLFRSLEPFSSFGSYASQVTGVNLALGFKLCLLFSCICWAVAPSLFSSFDPKPSKSKMARPSTRQDVPYLDSRVDVRREAWLTAIQTVWVPRHNFFLEAAALCLKTVKLSLRNLIGVESFQTMTGLSREEEIARVKAWSIALDAQLAGGDIEISKSRLTLTLLASGTLPSTPLRLMLKALHIRVLLWEFGVAGVNFGLVNMVASKLARAQWNEAKQLHRMQTQLGRDGQEQTDEDLPDHLAVLLEQDCDDVLSPTIIQRVHNLTWNRPLNHKAVGVTDGMDSVIGDLAVRSPMDAVAAWWSTITLHNVLKESLLIGETSSGEDCDTANDQYALQVIEEGLTLAIKSAPIGTTVQSRALVARALMMSENRHLSISAALQAIGPVLPSPASVGSVTDDVTSPCSPLEPVPAPIMVAESHTSLQCAMALAHIEKTAPPEEPTKVYALVGHIQPRSEMGILGYAATFTLMNRLAAHEVAAEACSSAIERLAGTLRIWTGKSQDLDTDIKAYIIDRCIQVSRGIVGMDYDTDTGYGSMSESEGDLESDVGSESPSDSEGLSEDESDFGDQVTDSVAIYNG